MTANSKAVKSVAVKAAEKQAAKAEDKACKLRRQAAEYDRLAGKWMEIAAGFEQEGE